MKALIDITSKLAFYSITTMFSVRSSFQLSEPTASLRKPPFLLRLANPSSVPLSEDLLPNLYAYSYSVFHTLLRDSLPRSSNTLGVSSHCFVS